MRQKSADNPGLEISTILLTMVSKEYEFECGSSAERAGEYFPEQTLRTEIPRSVRLAESPSYGETVITYDPRSTGAIAYRAAAHGTRRARELRS